MKGFSKELPWADEKIPKNIADRVFTKHLDYPLFFRFAPSFQAMSATLPDMINVVIFRMKYVPIIDQTVLYALEEAVMALEKRNIAFATVDITVTL